MKIKDGFVLSEIAGTHVAVAVGKRVKEFNGLIKLNEPCAYLWKFLEKGATEEELVAALIKEYEVNEERAKQDVKAFVDKLKEKNLLD